MHWDQKANNNKLLQLIKIVEQLLNISMPVTELSKLHTIEFNPQKKANISNISNLLR